MALAPGTRLGPYEIVAPLGSGGMGEVYRAKDTRLGREVAIKVLPPHLSANPEVRARFEREAKTVSSLNHPHICTLFDVGRAPGEPGSGEIDYLVMELVDGETLDQRVAKGALPMAETLKLGVQIADALDRAHRAGIVHRDLKPGNVMLTRGGAKLMDFGLARATGLAGGTGESGVTQAALTRSPTVATPLTAEGTIVGTFQYMAPEQLEGREADARCDIWALGCVLHEMATGRRPFEGRSQASLISAIMTGDPPPISKLVPGAPPALERVVQGCLAKDPADRIQSAHDVRLQLQWLAEPGAFSGSFAGVPARPAARGGGRERLAWGVAALFAALALLATGLWLRGGEREERVLRAGLPLPADVALSITGDESGPPELSPDGRMVVFAARGRGAGQRLWLRSLDDLSTRPLAGTEGASYPFWSPDGRSIGFYGDGQLKRLDLAGGAALKICDVLGGRGATWSRKGVIVFSPNWIGGLMQVPASGGIPTVATAIDSTRETTHRWPVFLPDGEHFLYLAANHEAADTSSALWYASLDGRTRRRLMSCPSNVVVASGRLLFVRDSTLLAQRFDADGGRLIGEPQPTREIVQYDPTTWRAMVTAGGNGVLVYGPGGNKGRFRVTWFDRTGHVLGSLGSAANHFTVQLSPDGRRAVVETQYAPNADLWVYDVASGLGSLLAPDPADDSQPVWSPDATQIAFASRRGASRYRVHAVRADGSTTPRVLVEYPDADAWVLQWVEGGRAMIVGRGDYQSGDDNEARWHPLDGTPSRVLIPATPGCVTARVSPDGRWLAFDSRVSGRAEVYVIPMPRAAAPGDPAGGSGGRWQVSSRGGDNPVWSRDGRELFYKRADDTMIAVSVDGRGEQFRVLGEREMFQAFQRGWIPTYDVSPDGSRFIVTTSSTEHQASLIVVSGWTQGLEGK